MDDCIKFCMERGGQIAVPLYDYGCSAYKIEDGKDIYDVLSGLMERRDGWQMMFLGDLANQVEDVQKSIKNLDDSECFEECKSKTCGAYLFDTTKQRCIVLPHFSGTLQDKAWGSDSSKYDTFTCDFKQQYEFTDTDVYKLSIYRNPYGRDYQ